MNKSTIIHWFRQDLRLSDNPALFEAAALGQVLPIYILDDENSGEYGMGAASRCWLHHSLSALNQSLKGNLRIYSGNPLDILLNLIPECKAEAVFWNRCYEPWRISRDLLIKEKLTQEGIQVKSFNGSLLWEPWEVLKSDGTPYRVFTPFYRKKCLTLMPPRRPLKAPSPLSLFKFKSNSPDIMQLNLLPKSSWHQPLISQWKMGEKGAQKTLDTFLEEGIMDYKEGRNFPAKSCVSRLSPYLHFGEISPNQAWHAVLSQGDDINIDYFCRELGWREFSYNLLYHQPDLPEKNIQSKFDFFPWRRDSDALKRWQKGQTGYPFVDAGMRELWQTGYMHNRVRMIVGSFLVKNLMLHWHHGARWFWDCLFDADLANNSVNWQWIAGCGADAAPYFRMFNPVTQGEKFDPTGEYIRHYVPELKALPNKYLFSPWETPNDILKSVGIEIGKTYPSRMVDLKASRERALTAFKTLPTARK